MSKLQEDQVPAGGGANNLVAEVSVSTAVTRVDFTGLDILTDGGYRAILKLKAENVTTVPSEIRLFFDTGTGTLNETSTSYSLSYVGTSDGTGVSRGVINGAGVTALHVTNLGAFAIIDIFRVGDILTYMSWDIRNNQFRHYRISGRLNVAATNMTKLAFVGELANSIGAGSVISLYKYN